METFILTINSGSSSVKFALYSGDGLFSRTLHGKIERIGLHGTTLSYAVATGKEETREIPDGDFAAVMKILDLFLLEHVDFSRVVAIGHRIVHGMGRKNHLVVTSELIAELKEINALDPEHLPFEIAIMEMFAKQHPALPQVACFDTVFHRDMPRVAQLLPLPRRFESKGVRRYGFHGLSLSSIMEGLQSSDPEKAKGRVIIAHLGNGASITAVKEGKSVDTSMGFTPTGGILMSSRTGDIDPGTLLYIMESEGLSRDAINHLINHESGLLGVSETSSDMHDLLGREATDERAREAVALFCYEAKKRIGAYITALGGVETIIFTGGMGENAPLIRARICEGLGFLGITLDLARNDSNEDIISSISTPVCVRVMHTDEELTIAHIIQELIGK